ncbi:MAG: hypothetical protein HND44_03265 [Chloroflexi bacterium]|nr:hypothetical protein [Ardenticatenaceae bacterium]MBL1127520.1 hypothetical protein [Chloroflexota bacterium]NOG33583.1 hypothetical protein [Chloroflexota bacterium]GIK56540.1 MAG: hypothetical protein BroJett015_22030 [Chloroflexota bacterium]
MRVTYLFSIVSGVFITAFLLLGIFHLGNQAAPLVVFTVNSTADATDAVPGDGVCETAPGNGICTLHAAIRESNALAGADEIILPAGTYLLTIPGANENNAATGDLDITGNADAGTTDTHTSNTDADRGTTEAHHLPAHDQQMIGSKRSDLTSLLPEAVAAIQVRKLVKSAK